jgi:hypothetical protein
MQPDHHENIHAAELGSLGGYRRAERLSAQERSAISSHAAWSRHHPREAQAARAKAQEQAYLIQQVLKNGRQLPLV